MTKPMDDLMLPTDDNFDVDYEVWVNDCCMAGSDNLDEAMRYAWMYLEEGEVEVVKLTRQLVCTMKR